MDNNGFLQLLDVTAQSLLDAVEAECVGMFHFGGTESDSTVGPGGAGAPAEPRSAGKPGAPDEPKAPNAQLAAEKGGKLCPSALQPVLNSVYRSGGPEFLDEFTGEERGVGATAVLPIVLRSSGRPAPPAAAAVLTRRGDDASFSPAEIRAARAVVKLMPDFAGGSYGSAAGAGSEFAYLESLFANASEAVVFLDLENRILRINDEFSRLFGYTTAEVEGELIDEVVASKATMDEARHISRMVESGERVSREATRIRKDGTEVDVSILGGPVYDRGKTIGIFGIYRDISEQKRTVAALRESERRYREIFERAPVGIFQTHSDGRTLSVNRTFAHMLGYESVDELMQVIGQSARAIYADPATRDRFLSMIRDRGAVQHFSYEAMRRDGSRIHFSENSRISEWHSQSDFVIDGFVADVTELRGAQREVEEKERRLRGIFNAARDVALVLAQNNNQDDEFRITEFSAGAERIFGYRQEQAIGLPLLHLHPPHERDAMQEKLQSIVAEEGTLNEELEMMRSDKREVALLFTANPVFDTSGRVGGIVEVAVDISERKRAEWAIEESLREKEVLLQEIHHRVKNNMQIISSILSLETSHITNPALEHALQVSQSRIRSMSLIHEKLYQSTDLARVDLAEYVRDLTKELKGMSPNAGEFELELELEPVYASVDFAIPLGLIVNELCTNAFKHAHGQAGATRIELQLGVTSEGIVLVVSDDGPGFASEDEMSESDSLGLELVRSLVSQVRGSIEYSFDDGAVWRVVVPHVS